MKRRIMAVSIAAVCLVIILVWSRMYRSSQSQSYILPVEENSAEMKTAELLSGEDGVFLFRYRSGEAFRTLKVYVSEYHDGKRTDHREAASISFNDSTTSSSGIIAIVPDFDHFSAKVTISDNHSKISADIPVLSGVEDRQHYARSSSGMEELTQISFGHEQGLAALMYGKTKVSAVPIDHFEGTSSGSGNEYEYYFSLKFEK